MQPKSATKVQPGCIALASSNTTIEFTGSTLLTSKAGHFDTIEGVLELKTEDPQQAKLQVRVEMKSVSTDIGLLTKHLLAEDFFDVARYPMAEFLSTSIVPLAGERYAVSGLLTLHGVQRAIRFPAQIHVNTEEVAIDGVMSLLQTEFGMVEAASKTKDEVQVRVKVRALRR